MNDPWTIAHENFIDDDGSLPSVEFSNLSPKSVCALFNYFRSHGIIVTEHPTLYDNSRDTEVPLDQFDDPAGLVVSGIVAPFHCCFGGVSSRGVEIPQIGLFVFQDVVELDYRMGSGWNRETVNGFFQLLVELETLAPESNIGSAEYEGVPFPAKFKEALDLYRHSLNAEQGIQPDTEYGAG